MEKVWRKGTLLQCWWDYKLKQVTIENSLEVP